MQLPRAAQWITALRPRNRVHPQPAAEPVAVPDLLASTGLWDVSWYAQMNDCPPVRAAVIEHYVTRGRAAGLSPHPLIDPKHLSTQFDDGTGADPFELYLRHLASGTAIDPSPLFRAGEYLAAHPDAAAHPDGPLGHFLAVSDGEEPDLVRWAKARFSEWRERRDAAGSSPAGPTASVDWDALPDHRVRPGLVSLLVSPRDDWTETKALVERIRETTDADEREVEILLVAAGRSAADSVALDWLASSSPDARIIHLPFHLARLQAISAALRETRGKTLVLLGNDCDPTPGWLPPLLAALEEPNAVVAGSLILTRTGTIHSAGYAVPEGRLPYRLLEGLPAEDADGLQDVSVTAIDSRAMAIRIDDFLRFRGFDPALGVGLADTDLCLRVRSEGGRVVLTPASRVVRQRGGQLPPSGGRAAERVEFLHRWAHPPEVDTAMWAHTSFRVLRYAGERVANERLIPAPIPVLTRRVESVQERNALRWAVKNPARADHTTHLWGDTNFARDLAEALRRLGQEVVVDLRPEFHRSTGNLDDVVVVLRGVQRHRPAAGQINLLWVMSHPELVSRDELAAYDHVFAAGPAWAERRSREWGIRITPLLQATNPRLFNPERARPDTGHRVLFVGNARATPRPVVMDAAASGAPLDVYGLGWNDWLPADAIRGTELPNSELGAAYRAAGVVLNDHWEGPRREGFVCNRLFDAVAAGARVISDPVDGIEALFGRCVQVSRGAEDMKRLLNVSDFDVLFGDDEERLRIARRVQDEHSFDRRAEELLRVALTYRHRITHPI